MTYDVAVIGAGVVGSAIARMLAGTHLSVALIDAANDVGDGTSKANTAILHTGFDATPGTLEARLIARGYHLMRDYAAATGIPIEDTGAVLVAWTEAEVQALPGLLAKAQTNGCADARLINAAAVYRLVPDLGEGALAGMVVPGESIMCTWTATLALATEAVRCGVTLHLDHRVTGVEVGSNCTALHTTRGLVEATWVINAAGLGGDELDRCFGYDRFTVTPRRGELIVFDKLARPRVPMIVLPVPTSMGKGVLVSPTIYGNVMVGPTAEDITDRSATGTTAAGLDYLLNKATKLLPALSHEEVTATYAGLRAATEHPDYVIDLDLDRRYVLVGGIRSTGLSACLAIAEYVEQLLGAAGVDLRLRGDLPPPPRMPHLGERGPRPYQDYDLIAIDPAYGQIVCFCERVTSGEIRDALAAELPPADLDGLRRRTRALNGRCQGFFCAATISALVPWE